MLGAKSSDQLAQIVAAVGLVQNLGALRALTTVGVVEGHMKLHAANLALAAGANKDEMPRVIKDLEEILLVHRKISLSQAIEVLNSLRSKKVGINDASYLSQ